MPITFIAPPAGAVAALDQGLAWLRETDERLCDLEWAQSHGVVLR